MIYLLDANALIRSLSRSPLMSRNAREVIDNLRSDDRLAVPTIALVEAWDVARKRRRDYVPFGDVMQAVADMGIMVIELTLSIVRLLPDEWTDTHDMIILATALDIQARHGEVTVISSDRDMRFRQNLVHCLW